MGYAIAKQLGLACVSGRTVKPRDAVMFDMDETLVHENGTPIPDMIALFKTCKKLGYKVIIITGRPDYAVNHHFTLTQLVKYKLFPDEVYFIPPMEKTRIKKQTGLHYILSVGDQHTDLYGSDYFIKLPDTFDRRVQSNIRHVF